MQKIVAIKHSGQSQTHAADNAEHADDDALKDKDGHDLIVGGADSLHQADLPRFHHHKGDQGASDAESGDDDDEKHDVKHQVFFDEERTEDDGILFHPR